MRESIESYRQPEWGRVSRLPVKGMLLAQAKQLGRVSGLLEPQVPLEME